MYLVSAIVFALCINRFLLEATPASSNNENQANIFDKIKNKTKGSKNDDQVFESSIQNLDRMIYTDDEPSEAFAANRDRIVGGQETTIEDHPYQVAFVVNNYFCGGFIINESWIMTAAHCTQNISDPSAVVLYAGSATRKTGTKIPIAAVIPHPGYNSPTMFDKDAGLLKTVNPIEFNARIQPIALPWKDRQVVANSNVEVSGWGKKKQSDKGVPNELYEVDLKVVDWNLCKFSYLPLLTKNMICAGNFYLGGEATCQGDSGGAAVQNGMAVGIVSFARGCGQPLSPSVFASISAPPIWNFVHETINNYQ